MRFFPFQLKYNSSYAGYSAKKANSPLVNLGPHDNLRQIGPGQRRHEIPHQIDKLNSNDLPVFIDLVQPLEELDWSQLLKLLLEIGFLLETLSQLDRYGNDLPDYAE